MRQRKATSSDGTVNRRGPSTRELLLLLVLSAVGLWMLWSFGQQLALSHRLGQQAAQLRQQNAATQAANDGYRRDMVAMASGGGAEEEARLNGYARSDEKLYLIAAPPPQPAPAKVTVTVDASQGNPVDSVRRWLADHLPR